MKWVDIYQKSMKNKICCIEVYRMLKSYQKAMNCQNNYQKKYSCRFLIIKLQIINIMLKNKINFLKN